MEMRFGYQLALCIALMLSAAVLCYLYKESNKRSAIERGELRRSAEQSKKLSEKEREEELLQKRIAEDQRGEKWLAIKADLDLLAKQLESNAGAPLAKESKDHLEGIAELFKRCRIVRLQARNPEFAVAMLTTEDQLHDVVKKWRAGELEAAEVGMEIEVLSGRVELYSEDK